MSAPVEVRRFPRWVFGSGAEPDPRFTLANERTFLAWIRTSLALSAAGVALQVLDLPLAGALRLACAALLVVLGGLAAAQAWWGWAVAERALREGRPLRPAPLGPVLAVGVAAAGGLLLAALFLS